MKEFKIKEIFDFNDLIILTNDLFDLIKLSYGLTEPQEGFTGHFINVLKKYHGEITFQQIESAFEYNAVGYLNEYLPKLGHSVDSKVKFTIPDLTKIIKAYVKFKNLNLTDEAVKVEKTEYDISLINREWEQLLNSKFELYMNYFEKSEISIPIFYCDYLSKLGLLNANEIDRSEKKIIIAFGKSKKIKSTHNIDLIYKCFDRIIESGYDLRYYINQNR